MKEFSPLAKLYISAVLLSGIGLMAWLFSQLAEPNWWLLAALCGLAALLQAIKTEGSTTRTSYNLSWVIYGFTLVLMGAPAAMLVILVSHLVEWFWHRYVWYIQSFNIASFGLAAAAAGLAYSLISPSPDPLSLLGCLAILAALALFTLTNHLLIGLVVKLARGQSLAESGVMSPLSLALDFGMLCLGAAGAFIWAVNPYAVVFVALLAVLFQNVLHVPSLRRQSETDPKLGLFNARYFAKTLDVELERANRFNRPLTLAMADLDLLRRVNNEYGHLAGDAVLKGVAEILGRLSREFDTVARFGGEEFAILMPETTPPQAHAVVEAMRQAIADARFTVATSVTPIKVTMSFGIAGRLHDNLSAEQLVHHADLAVYEAKQAGRNRTRDYAGGHVTAVSEPQDRSIQLETRSAAHGLNGSASDVSAQDRPAHKSSGQGQAQRPRITEESGPAPKPYNPWLIRLFVGSTATIALLLAGLLIRPITNGDWLGLAAFTVLVVLVEALALEIYVKETSVSTSAAPLVAGVLLFGPAAAVILGLSVALAAFVRQRSKLDRLIFNGGNHMIGGLIVTGLMALVGWSFVDLSMPVQIAVSLLAMGIVYISTTALVACAVSLNNRQPFRMIWSERFRWLAPYFLALGVVAFALVFSYFTAGLLGILVILVPLFMLRFSQKQYIDHTKKVVSQLRANNLQLTHQAEEISLLNEELLVALAQAADMRDPYVMEHSLNVARYAELIARELGLAPERVEMVRKAGLLHDIGKLSIPESILFKPDLLTPEEYETVKEHVTAGAELIQGCHSLHPLIPFIRHHHEFFDGSGYPDGIAGKDIPLEARILCAADALEAMASDRPYRKGRTPQGIVRELRSWAGRQFDPEVVEAFVRVVEREGHEVILNSARDVQARVDQPEGSVKIENRSGSQNILLHQPALVS